MNWKRILGIIAIMAVIALVVVKLILNKQKTEKKVYIYDKESPITVGADTLKIGDINDANVYTGTFEPNKETKLSADVQGKVNSILVDVGSSVHKGQVLLQLDNSLLKLQLQTVEIQIEGLQDDVNRYTILTKADAVQGVQLEKVQLGLRTAQVQRATLLEQINKTSVKAPFNGIVTFKFTEEGAFAAPGVPLLQITDISTLRFTVNVPEINLKQFHPKQLCNISVDVLPNISLSGKITMVGSKANMGNSFPVQLMVTNTKDLDIKSGMFGKVNMNEEEQEQGIVIPASAIIEDAGKKQVYLIKNGKATLQTITVSKNIGNNAVISSGLNEGNVIITNGFINLFNGANVIVK